MNPKDKWFNYAITDHALFHATMMHAAMHQRVVSGGLDQREQVQLKTNAIMMVNQRLEDPILSRNDVTIGAVVCLVLLEVSRGGNADYRSKMLIACRTRKEIQLSLIST